MTTDPIRFQATTNICEGYFPYWVSISRSCSLSLVLYNLKHALAEASGVDFEMHVFLNLMWVLASVLSLVQDQVKKSLLHMDVMLWDASALLRAETREVLTSGNIGNGTAQILVNISTIDATTKQKYQNEFAQTAAANAVRYAPIIMILVIRISLSFYWYVI